MAVTKIDAWKTSDGQLFKTELEANRHEHQVLRVQRVRDFWNEHGYSGMTASDAEKICLEHYEKLREVLR